jgi:hypothetical protein
MPTCNNQIDSININYAESMYLQLLRHDVVKYLNFSVKSPKGESLPVKYHEKENLTYIFGKHYIINLKDVVVNMKILYQDYKNNCWFYGYVSDISENHININNCIFINRGSGSIFRITPINRSIIINKEDQLFNVT